MTKQQQKYILRKIEKLSSTTCNVGNKLLEAAIKEKKFGVMPFLKFLFKIDTSFKAIVKAIDLPNDKNETMIMVSAIASHSMYLKSEAACEIMVEAVRGVMADLVNTAMLKSKSQLVDLCLDKFCFEGVAIDIPFLLEKSGLCYNPHWLKKLFDGGAKLKTCDKSSIKAVLLKKYEQPGVKLQMMKLLVENDAEVSFDTPNTTVIHEVVRCIICENGSVDTLDLVCRKFDFLRHEVCDKEGKTPWHLALAGKRKIGIEICNVLSKYSIDPSKKDKSDRRADYRMKDEDERVKILRNKEAQIKGISKESAAGKVHDVKKKKRNKKRKKNKENEGKPGETESSERLFHVDASMKIKSQGGNDEHSETLDIADENETVADNLGSCEKLSQADVLNEHDNQGESIKYNPVSTSGAREINEEMPDALESWEEMDVSEADRPDIAIGLEGLNSKIHHNFADNNGVIISTTPNVQEEHDPESQNNTLNLGAGISSKAFRRPVAIELTKEKIKYYLDQLQNQEDGYFRLVSTSSKQTVVQNSAVSNTGGKVKHKKIASDAQKTDKNSSSMESPDGRPFQKKSTHKDHLPVEGSEFEEYYFKNALWDIECCKKVMKILSGKKHKYIKKIFLAKMKILSQGDFMGNRKHCKSVSSIKGVELYETRLNDKDRVIWQIVPQLKLVSGKDEYREIIRVWDIVLDHDNIHHHVEVIERNIHERAHQVPDKLKVKLKSVSPNESNIHNNKRHPRLFSPCQDELMEYGDVFCPPMNPEKNSYCIAHLYSLSNCVVKLMLEDGDIERAFPYKEWPAEHDIINLPYKPAVLLLGRSGTGKTTCCLYRMWNEFVTYWKRFASRAQELSQLDTQSLSINECSPQPCETSKDYEEECSTVADEESTVASPDCESKLHQIFVTKNYVLCSRLRKQFLKFCDSEECAQYHIERMLETLPNNMIDIHDLSYPLFLTARQLYILLDYSLQDGEYFFNRDEDGNMTERIMSTDYDHEATLSDTLYDLDDSVDDEPLVLYPTSHEESSKKVRREVTASYFKTNIWPEIKKGNETMSPLLVWMEIKSFIKGSCEAIESEKGYLTEEEYIRVGQKAAPNFAGNRQQIYAFFERYKIHVQNHPSENLFDECDLVHNLFRRLPKEADKMKWVLHSIYIDEVQDFTQGELWLMLHNCSDPNRVFLTGDTAQSIMSGIAFRFEDVKTLFHHLKLEIPEVKHLTINFRAHSGILRLASSVTDLLKEYFPYSFDHNHALQEQGLVDGPKPVLLDHCPPTDLAVALAGKKRTATMIDFGAHQAILVRTQEAKEKLPRELKAAIVLTIFESKGLEFDDVVLYNFFTDSKVNKNYYII